MRRLLEGGVFFLMSAKLRFSKTIEFTTGQLFFLEHLYVVVPVCVLFEIILSLLAKVISCVNI